MQPQTAEVLAKLTEVESNAWLLFKELPPCGAKMRALRVLLDAKAIKARLAAEDAPTGSDPADPARAR